MSARGWLVVVLAVVAFPAAAERVSRSEFNAFRDIVTGATSHEIRMSSTGVPLATRGTGGATGAGNMNFSHSAGGFPKATGQVDLQAPNGKSLPVTATQSFSKASQAAALAKFAMKLAVPITAGMAMYDLLVDLKLVSSWHEAEKTNSFQEEIKDEVCPAKNLSQGVVDQSCKDVTSSPNATGSLVYRVANGQCQWSVKCVNPDYHFSWEYLGAPSNTIRYEDRDEGQIASLIAQRSGWPSAFTAADRAMADAMNSGIPIELETVDAAQITPAPSAPSTQVVGDPKTTTLSDGTTQTSRETCEWVQGIPPGPLEWRCWVNTTTVTPQKTTTETVTKSNPDGTTSTETITKTTPSTTTTGTSTGAQFTGCGLPGGPKCAIDETNVKQTVTMALDEATIAADATAKREVITGTADKGFFATWGDLWSAPPVAQCEPFSMPPYMGMSIPQINPCGFVGTMRTIMGFVWAFIGIWLCVGMVKEVM